MVVAKRKEGRCAATELVELVLWCTELHQRPPMLAPTTRRTCTKQLDADILKAKATPESRSGIRLQGLVEGRKEFIVVDCN